MSWQEIILAGGSTQRAYHDYIDERVAALTKVCTALTANVEDIRLAQAGIFELRRLQSLPETLGRSAQSGGKA